MGFFIRKAFRFGPIRFNVSKSGVGTSIGVRGLRVGQDARGKGYAFGGRRGLYFRERLRGGGGSGCLVAIAAISLALLGALIL